RLAMHSVSVFRELQRSDVKPDWHEVGSLRIALSDGRAKEFCQLKRAADNAGLDADLIDNAEAKRRWPSMDFNRVKAVLWCPSDGNRSPCIWTRAAIRSRARPRRSRRTGKSSTASKKVFLNSFPVRKERKRSLSAKVGRRLPLTAGLSSAKAAA